MKRPEKIALVVVMLAVVAICHSQASHAVLEIPRLAPPFTLRFKVTEKDLRTTEQLAADLETMKQQYAELQKAGHLGDTDVPGVLQDVQSSYEQRRNGWTYTVSITASKDGMLYRTDDGTASTTIYYDGKNYYRIVSPGPSIFKSFGVVLQDLQALPFAGVNLPVYPWIRGVESSINHRAAACEVLPFRSSTGDPDHEPAYSDGTVSWDYLNGNLFLRSVVVGTDDHPSARFSFHNAVQFAGIWLAKDSDWCTYRPLVTPGKGTVWWPWLRVSFSLTRASRDAQPQARFTPESYGTVGCPVLVENKGRTVAFPFVSGKTIDQQAKDEKDREDRDAYLTNRGALPVQSYSGIVLLMFLVFLIAAFCVRSRKTRP